MLPRLKVRAGHSGDIARCRDIDLATQDQFVDAGHAEFGKMGVIPDGPAERAVEEGRILVAEFDGDVVGWVFLTRSEGELCIGQIAVSPSMQRRGIGTALIARIIIDARVRREESIVLSTQSDIEWNQPWYEQLGFEIIPPEQWTNDMRTVAREQGEAGLDWNTRVHMRLRISGVPNTAE
ncbi:MAG: GNAT family N-acetyltransferase [Actinomycetota bacterium]